MAGPEGDVQKAKTGETGESPVELASTGRERLLNEAMTANIGQAGGSVLTRSDADVAKSQQDKGLAELSRLHANLNVTTDGSAPRQFDFNDHYQVQADTGALDLAAQVLGSGATAGQREHFAQRILIANDRLSETVEQANFSKGARIKMPGQTADGGVIVVRHGDREIDWSDGSSYQVGADGEGRIFYQSESGESVEVAFNPRDRAGTYETRSRGDTEVTIDNESGHRLERRWVEGRGGDGQWEVSGADTRAGDRQFHIDVKPGSDTPDRIVMKNADQTEVELKKNGSGEFVSADGLSGVVPPGRFYRRETGPDGQVKRTYDSGAIEVYDSKNNLLHFERRDDWDRKVTGDFTGGGSEPSTITVEEKDGRVVSLDRQKNGSYKSDYLDGDGKKIGTIELGGDGRLIYKNDACHCATTTLADGTTAEMRKNADGSSLVSYNRGGESYVAEYDPKGKRSSETFQGSESGKLTIRFGPGGSRVESVLIDNKDGSSTQLHYDAKNGYFSGTRTDDTGKVLENVRLQENKLVFTDATSGADRVEMLNKPTGEHGFPRLLKGSYDRGTGSFTYNDEEGHRVIESFAPGRKDVVGAGGDIEGSTITGDISSLKTNGEATVLHSDGSGVRLNPDETIDRWGSKDAENAYREALSPEEAQFLRSHGDIDRRDLAEIHRRLDGDPGQLDAFYKSLARVDTASNLSNAEKSTLRQNIMRHVAYPGEIYQGRSPSCNVSVVQRDLAMESPDRYASLIVDAVSSGEITTSDGTRVPLDPDNLKRDDASGRDLASRIAQNLTIAAEFYPRFEFRSTDDGIGLLYRLPRSDNEKPLTFQGMNLPTVVEARYKLTGEEKAIVSVDNSRELMKAFELNGEKPMIIAVNGSSPPFDGAGPVGSSRSSANHVVTLTRIDHGPPARAFVHNQWGLKSDHATAGTAIPLDDLVKNMRVKMTHEGVTATAGGMVVMDGDHRKAYEITRRGKVESRTMSNSVQLGLSMDPGETR
ncbi:MAG: hypothetical protein KC777_03290 [Cyanobacteria bacterium HKST-UBA02]|nr:hypothetical protein [Cyanobacteria bacterium HKST-UBA02]